MKCLNGGNCEKQVLTSLIDCVAIVMDMRWNGCPGAFENEGYRTAGRPDVVLHSA